MEYKNEYTEKLEKDINIAIELLDLLKTSPHKGGNFKGINYAEIKRTRLIINELLMRNEG